jgi:hypothetical protein
MKFSLTITGSAAALAAAMRVVEDIDGFKGGVGVGYDYNPSGLDTAATGNSPSEPTVTPSINTGAGIPQPMPDPSAANGVASTPTVPMPTMSPVSTTTPSGPTGEGEPSDGTGLDAEGLPWDARIHSSTKTKTAKGLWTAVRNGPKGAELAAIKAQLRGAPQQPVPMPAVSEPVVVAPVPMPAVSEPVAAMPTPAPVPMPIPMPAVSEPLPVAAMPTPAPAAPVEPVAVTQEWDFAKLMGVIGPKIGTTISTEYLVGVCQKYGIAAVTDTATKPEVIPQLIAQFQADGVW